MLNMLKYFFKMLLSPELDCEAVVTQITKSYGEKPQGFQEYLQKCKRIERFLTPNSVPDYCIGYEVPEEIILHEIMMQPFFQRHTFKARKEDILIVGFPKTGTSWMQEICYTVCSKGDLTKANAKPLTSRMMFFEIPFGGMSAIEDIQDDPRIFKTHLPYHLLPNSFIENKSKIVYITRNPKDALVSSYFFCKSLIFISYTGTMKEYLEAFLNEKVLYGSFARNVLAYWNRRHEENICFVTYEQLQKDARGGIEKISDFTGQKLTKAQLDTIVDHTCFKQMAENPMTNYSSDSIAYNEGAIFMRKGQVGDWKNYFDEEMNRKMDEYIKKNFEGTGLEFEYEI